MASAKPRILVITLAIGNDYRSHLTKALQSKRDYCLKHGYDYKEYHDEVWNRERPISWSKVPVLKEAAGWWDRYDYIWISDADVYITNQNLKLEDHVLPLLPKDKDFLMTYDSCEHVNAGNIIFRPCKWAVDFFEKVWNQTDCIYHIWWENKAICDLMATSPEDVAHIECTMKAWTFNAYLRGVKGARLWQPGDFLVHFAGVYDPKEMNYLIEQIDLGNVPRLRM